MSGSVGVSGEQSPETTRPNLPGTLMSEASMYRVVADYFATLPGAVKEGMRIFSTHSLRATSATLLLDAGVDIWKAQSFVGHRHVTTTQIY